MLARLMILSAMILPAAAQEPDDVTKFLTEIRAKHGTPREDNSAAQASLAELTKRVETATSRTQKAETYHQIAMVNRSLGDLDASVAAARVAHDLEPGNGRFSADLAMLLAENHQATEASAILGADATDGNALVERARQLTDDGEKDLAIACLQLAQKLAPDDPGVNDHLAIVYLRAERVDDAIRALNRAVEKEPESALLHLHLAFAFARKDYRGYARGELNQALECHPSDEVREGIGQLRALLDAPK